MLSVAWEQRSTISLMADQLSETISVFIVIFHIQCLVDYVTLPQTRPLSSDIRRTTFNGSKLCVFAIPDGHSHVAKQRGC